LIRSFFRSFKFLKGNRALQSLVAAALLAELAYAILNLSAMPMYVKLSLNKGAMLGIIISTFLLTEAISRPIFGALGDKIGRKPLLIAGPVLTAITAYLTAHTHSVAWLIGLRVIDGFGSGALWPTAYATIGDIVEEENTSAAMSLLNVTYMGGLALAFVLGGTVNQIFASYTASFYLVSIMLILTVIVLAVSFPSKIVKHTTTKKPTALDEHAPVKLGTLLRSFREVPDMVVLACVSFLGMGMLTPIVKLYGVEHLRLTEFQFGVAVAPIALAMGVLAVPLGRFSDRYGKNMTLCWSLLICSVAMFSIALFRSWAVAGIAGIAIGVGFTAAFPAWNALVVSSTSPERRGEVLGAVGMAQGLAAIAGAVVGSYLYDNDFLSLPRLGISNYNLPFWLSGIFLYAGAIVAFTWVFARHGHKDPMRSVEEWHRKSVVTVGVIGLIVLGVWVGYRYTQPIPPDRVAWEYVQELARNRPAKAARYVDISIHGDWEPVAETQESARLFHGWVEHGKAHYTVLAPDIMESGEAVVEVRFTFPGNMTKGEQVKLSKSKDREWRVCGMKPIP